MQSNNIEQGEQQQADGQQQQTEADDGNNNYLELDSLSREDLIKLVKCQLLDQKRMQQQLAVAKEEADKSSKNAKELATKMGKMALLASQHKVEELITEMANLNVECVEAKRVDNPTGNSWNSSMAHASVSISTDGRNARNDSYGWHNVIAEKGFAISGGDFADGTIIYYYEVTQKSPSSPHWCTIYIGLSDGKIPDSWEVGFYRNSYSMLNGRDCCCLAGRCHGFERPIGPVGPVWSGNGIGYVYGCGILVTKNRLALLFTLNGILMGQFTRVYASSTMRKVIGRRIPIKVPGNYLYPTLTMRDASLEVNFGDDLANMPFKYNIDKCPGMVFE